MPTYDYLCQTCTKPFVKVLPLSLYDTPQECPECGGPGQRQISCTNFVLKGDGWAGKGIRVKGQMERKNAKLGQKSKDHVGSTLRLAPNVDGERVDSWSEAQKLAASKGMNTTSYDPLVQKERGGK